MTGYVRWFREIRLSDLSLVGGKTALLGELHGERAAAGVPRSSDGGRGGARDARLSPAAERGR